MKIRKYKKLRLKWIMGRDMTRKEIAGLQSVHPESEWKNKIKASANPEYRAAWSPRMDKIYQEWLREQVENGSIKEMPKKMKWKEAEVLAIKP